MTPQDFQTYLNCQKLQIQTLSRIADALEQLAPPKAPNYQLSLESWRSFDWASIGARVELADNYGAGVVSWRGLQFQRRAPNNRFGEAIFFSRCVGKDETGQNQYERLCTFKPMSKVTLEPLPEKVARLV